MCHRPHNKWMSVHRSWEPDQPSIVVEAQIVLARAIPRGDDKYISTAVGALQNRVEDCCSCHTVIAIADVLFVRKRVHQRAWDRTWLENRSQRKAWLDLRVRGPK